MSKFFTLLKSKWALGIITLAILGGGYSYVAHRAGASYQFITVTRGSITETVSVTGNTTPMKSVSLGFQNTGTVAHVYRSLGDRVSAGEIIADLNSANLYAALQQARANLAVAEANLASLMAGTRPEQLAIDQSTVAQDQIALANAIASAYAAADSAVHTTADQFFTNPRTTGAELTFIVPDAMLTSTVTQERIALEPVLSAWDTAITAPSFGSDDPTAVATEAVQALAKVSAFLADTATALTKTQPSGSVTATNLTSYASGIASARTAVASALAALTSAKTALVSAQGALTLARAGSTPEAIAAQQAQVAQAQAGVTNAQANVQNAQIVAPITGTITKLDAKIGQLATPGTPLVSIVGNSGFEVDAGVAEIDVGKLAVGNKVTMTLDAFPNETFTGAVFYIAPAETNSQGVITYLVKISFDKADSRLKSGLTANIVIDTKRDDNVLILPQYAILQNDRGTFIETLSGKVATTTPVILGIQDQNGNVEILSGATEGERVITIGLKAK